MRPGTALLLTAVAVIAVFFAYNYWFQCVDFGPLGFCGWAKKPL